MIRSIYIFLFTALIIMAGALLPASNAYALDVNNVRVGLHEDKTRLVFDLSDAPLYRSFILSDPMRLVVDMPDFAWKAGTISKPVSSGVKDIRFGNLKPGISRIVIDLDYPVAVKSTFILPSPPRLVVDFKKVSMQDFASQKGKIFGKLDTDDNSVAASSADIANTNTPVTPSPESATQKTYTPPKKPATTKKANVKDTPLYKPLIVIDAGHGGVDPGAIGANGIFEKHITLALAKELQKQLTEGGAYRVTLTRDNDVYLKLHERVNFARKRDADLFVSIHADTIDKSHVNGMSVYTLSETASDKQTARLAARENRADKIAGVDISDEDKQVANILIDLAMRDTMNQSKFFANTIVDTASAKGLNMLENPHRYAGFAVLKAPDIPSILVEAGFLSNREEARLLTQKSHREKIARAIKYGIDKYFDKVEQNKN